MPKRLLKRQNRFSIGRNRLWTRMKSVPRRLAAWWGRRHLATKIALAAAAFLAAIVLVGVVSLRMWIRAPAGPDIIINRPSPSAPVLPSGASPLPMPSGEDTHDPPPGPEYVRREGVYTFLLAGVNEGLTDTLMVATLDTAQGVCHVLSIPRDAAVANAPRSIQKINSAYSQQRNTWDDEPGIAQMKKEIATLIGFQPQYAAVVDYNAFLRLVTVIGGVRFNVPMRMHVPYEGIDLQPGLQDLNADQALQLVRFRYDPVTGRGYDDYGRMRMQQQFLAAAAKKALSNWTRFPEYIRIAQSNVESDIDWGNLLWFADQINSIGIDNVVFSTLPTVSVRRPAELAGEYYEMVLSVEALELLNETINPFTVPIGEELVEYIQLSER
ncbi:MAG: LCP family protein [Oscillospiraceae bacterium]|nr:LCP family protein [Oscillospiraceae bacterium]